MALSITATPNKTNGSVLVQVALDAASSPIELINVNAAQIKAEGTAVWRTPDEINVYGDLASFYHLASRASVQRIITGLTVGVRYQVTLEAQRSPAEATAFEIHSSASGSMGFTTIPKGSGVWAHSKTFVANATSVSLYLLIYKNSNPYIRRFSVRSLPVGWSDDNVSLTRTDANGVQTVRLLSGQALSNGSLVVTDHEAALVGDVTYTFRSGTNALASVTTSLAGAATTLAPSVFPQFGITDVFVTGYDAQRESGTRVHEVIGRSDPVARIGAMKTRRGTLSVWCEDYAGTQSVLDVYARGEVVLLRQPNHAGLDLYHVTTGVRQGAYDSEFKRWRLDVDFIEVASPLGPLLGTVGWTWDNVAQTFATWDDAQAFFATWNELQIGTT